MKTIMRILVTIVAIIIICVPLNAQTTPPASWPVCRLGKAPVAPGPPPTEAVVFQVKGGPVAMSEAGLNGAVKWIRCNLPINTPSYRGADGVLRDVASNQPFFPVGWDAVEPAPISGPKGDPGTSSSSIPEAPPINIINNNNNIYMPPVADDGPPPNHGPYKTGHHCGKGCKILIGTGIGIGAVIGIVIATHHTGTTNGVPPGGVTGPAF